MPDDRAFAIAAHLLTAAVASLSDPPARQAVVPGSLAAWDGCPQVTVAVRRIGPSTRFPAPAAGPTYCAVMPVLDACIEVVRCTPVPDDSGTAPSPDRLEESARQNLTDVWELFDGFMTRHLDGSLVPEGCTLLALGASEPVGPSGGMVAARLCLQVQVGGAP